MDALGLVSLPALLARSSGTPAVTIGLIDGPVAVEHPDLEGIRFREIAGRSRIACTTTTREACVHGTFVAGILCARRGSPAPAICPDCTFLLRPVFAETAAGSGHLPSTTPQELAAAITDCVDSGSRIINLSLALSGSSGHGERAVGEALESAARRGVIVVAAAGNQGLIGSSVITRHPSVVPVVACDLEGRPIDQSTLAGSIGRRGLRAPGKTITSLRAEGGTLTLDGSSVAAPFVTGAIALLWSLLPMASAAQIRFAVSQATAPRRVSVLPPLLDATAAFRTLSMMTSVELKDGQAYTHRFG